MKIEGRKEDTVEELNLYKYTLGKCGESDKGHCFLIFSSDLDTDKELILNIEKELISLDIEVFWVNSAKYSSYAKEFGNKMVVFRPKQRKYMSVDCEELDCILSKTENALKGKGNFKTLLKMPEFKEVSADL